MTDHGCGCWDLDAWHRKYGGVYTCTNKIKGEAQPMDDQADQEAAEIFTFCPECGINVRVDEEGLCRGCGATAMGSGVDALRAQLAEREKDKANLKKNWEFLAGELAELPDLRDKVRALEPWVDRLKVQLAEAEAKNQSAYIAGLEAAKNLVENLNMNQWMVERIQYQVAIQALIDAKKVAQINGNPNP